MLNAGVVELSVEVVLEDPDVSVGLGLADAAEVAEAEAWHEHGCSANRGERCARYVRTFA